MGEIGPKFINCGINLLCKVEKMFNLHCKLIILYTGTDQYKKCLGLICTEN